MSTYQELLINEYAKQYATHWFKMDEGSGNILNDSKGNVVGTINGTTWLQDGGLIFDGVDDSVGFDSPVFPSSGGIYFSFDIKKDSITNNSTGYEVVFSTDNVDWGKNGILVRIFKDGNIRFHYYDSKLRNAIILLANKELYLDGKWHTFYFAWDGTTKTNGAKLFVDNLETPVAQYTALNNNIGHSYNLRIGYSSNFNNHDGTGYFKGSIKNFCVYNQDITKLNINKTLILSNGKTKTYISNTWENVTEPLDSTVFLNKGMDDLSILNRQVTELPPMQMEDKTNILFTNGEVGKVYQKTLDLQKYIDIIGIRVEMK